MEWFRRFYNHDYFKYRYEPRLSEVPAEEVDFLVQHGRLEPGGARRPRVFDICCGTGRHARPLALRGCEVVGVDLSPANIDAARRLARRQGLADRCRFVRGDIRDCPVPADCDLAINMFTSFGYFDTDAEDAVIIAQAARSLRPGGLFILDVANREAAIAGFRPRQRRGRPGNYVIEEACLDLARGRVEGTWTFVRAGRKSRHHVSIRLYALHELAAMVSAHGLAFREALGDFAGSTYDRASPRCIVVAEKGT